MHHRFGIAILFLSLLCFFPVHAGEIPLYKTVSFELTEEPTKKKILQSSLWGVGAITLWGIFEWDYFSNSPHCQSEGWFGSDTDNGGADKVGHAYSTYALSHALSSLYENWGVSKKKAALYGSTVSFALMGYLEFGDSYSDYGFSAEDFLANGFGAVIGYLLYRNDSLAEKIDFRWEFGLEPNKFDIFTDYENAKYLLALKFSGFESTKRSFLRNLEFHLGYYTRNYSDDDLESKRNIYFGIGLNLSDILSRHSWDKTATALKYVQLPYTYISTSYSPD